MISRSLAALRMDAITDDDDERIAAAFTPPRGDRRLLVGLVLSLERLLMLVLLPALPVSPPCSVLLLSFASSLSSRCESMLSALSLLYSSSPASSSRDSCSVSLSSYSADRCEPGLSLLLLLLLLICPGKAIESRSIFTVGGEYGGGGGGGGGEPSISSGDALGGESGGGGVENPSPC